ncbi:MAG: pantoate--beta-alanine ligase [Actinobacteria bacterium]|nr:pantoate--beta-alanine ligase [Actinomycetota bacterium]
MERTTTIAGVRVRVAEARSAGARIGLVPTMGALHAGHLSLVERCRDLADLVVVSIFVNPTQFGPGEDLDAYPRDLEGDEAALRALGPAAPDVVFAPAVDEVYPRDPVTTVSVRGLDQVLCGVSRPTHFDGVTTVVTKLLNIVQPDVAVFGRKDFQQLTILRRMVADLDVPVELVGGPIVREPDGVAMSSRNRYLEGVDRTAARALSRALRAAVAAARAARAAGEVPSSGVLRDAATVRLRAEPGARIDYVEVLDPDTLAPPPDGADRWLVAVAAFVGPARLIDNVVVGERADEDALLAATDDR